MNRPVIGITKPIYNGKIAFILTCIAVWLAGGRPIALTVNNPRYHYPIQGLILGGGTDIYPEYYGGEIKPSYIYDKERDLMEMAWFKKAQIQAIPILGICRGSQLMNIARGGSLYFDVRKAFEKAQYPSGLMAKIFFRKTIHIKHDSLLHAILCIDTTRVNSSHTQSVHKLGDNLVITAREENEVVQALEDPAFDFLLGVQFHPEFLIYSKKFRNIFTQLIQQSK